MTAVLLWILRLVVLLLVIRLIVRGMSAVFRQRSVSAPAPGRGRGRGRAPERLGGTLVRDPQCGTYIPESRAVTVGHGPDAPHFCSTSCRDAWMAAHGRARVKA